MQKYKHLTFKPNVLALQLVTETSSWNRQTKGRFGFEQNYDEVVHSFKQK